MRRSASTPSMSHSANDSGPAHTGTDHDDQIEAAVEPAAPLSGSSAHADADLTALIVAGKAQGFHQTHNAQRLIFNPGEANLRGHDFPV